MADGVGTYELTVAVNDPAAATITNASDDIGGTARTEFAADNSSVHIGGAYRGVRR